MNKQETSRIIAGLQAVGWNEKEIADLILYVKSGEEQYKPTKTET